MATLTVQIVSGTGTTNSTATFSASDAQRILTDFQKFVAGATQQNLGDFLLADLKQKLSQMVQQAEQPSGPSFS